MSKAAAESPPKIAHDTKGSKFVMEGGVLAEYSVSDGVMDIYHTFTPSELRGKGLAGKVVRVALDYCKANNLKVKPTCSYVAHFMSKTEEDKKLIA